MALAVATPVMEAMTPVSIRLQSKELNMADALAAIDSVRGMLAQMRENAETSFVDIFSDADAKAKQLDVEILVPRRNRQQAHRSTIPGDAMQYFRRSIYIPFLDFVLAELNSRFGERPANFNLQQLIPKFKRPDMTERVMEAVNVYEADMAMPLSAVKTQLILCERACLEEGAIERDFAACVRRAEEEGLCTVARLLRIFGTFPVTTATAERSFSSLRRLKTYLRSTMGQARLSGLALVNIHRQMHIPAMAIVDEFRHAKNRRLDF